MGRSMRKYLVTQKGVLIIDIRILRSRDSSHREIETQRESSFKGSIPMGDSTSGSRETKLIIVVVAAAV